MLYIIKVGSITNAQRAAKLLRIYGLKPTVERLEKPTKQDGCGYTLKVRTDNIQELLKVLHENGVTVLGADSV